MLQLNFSPFPELTTERLVLREMRDSDAGALFEIRNGGAKQRTMEETIALLERIKTDIAANQAISWTITLKEDGRMIGDMAFWRILHEHHRAELGYSLHKDFHRKGYATEALGVVLQYGFDVMKLHSVEANTAPENIASISLLKKYGFEQEGYFRENYYLDGKFYDTTSFSLLTPHR